jgi:hypothetical protein
MVAKSSRKDHERIPLDHVVQSGKFTVAWGKV